VLLPAQVYVSKPGRLPCKAIIHAVGPIWSSGHMNEKNLLYETVFNILEEAESRGFASVALPAISTGNYGFPLRLAANTILEAVRNFLKQPMSSRSLHEVHVIDQSVEVISQFCETAAAVVFKDVDNAEVVNVPAGDVPAKKVAPKSAAQTPRTIPGQNRTNLSFCCCFTFRSKLTFSINNIHCGVRGCSASFFSVSFV